MKEELVLEITISVVFFWKKKNLRIMSFSECVHKSLIDTPSMGIQCLPHLSQDNGHAVVVAVVMCERLHFSILLPLFRLTKVGLVQDT